ncbi:MAG TPA: FliH/SctL family protein [Intrasporangium sp.]|nr:FliH/SctL family protein [Intrasporangium sp.]
MSTETPLVQIIKAATTRPVVFPAVEPAGEAEGYTRGHAAGYAAGLRRATAEAAARDAQRAAEHEAVLAGARTRADRAVQVLDAAARALKARTAPVLAEAEGELAAAALVLAQAVVGNELSDPGGAARAALARALSGPDHDAVISVRLNPVDLALLDEHATQSSVSLVPDPSLAPGDAVAVYPDGELDARIASALSRATAALTGEEP